MTRLSFVTPLALNLASASDSEVKPFAAALTSVAAGTLTLPGTRPGRPYRLRSGALWECGAPAVAVPGAGPFFPPRNPRLSPQKPRAGRALERVPREPPGAP